MKTINKTIISMAITATLLFNFFLLSAAIKQGPAPVKNIVLVHGAFVDGSGWKPVYDILVKKGYHVSIVQQPLTTFIDDVNAVKRILALQDGPCILVAHSYGEAIITEASNDPHVACLVYIAAHAPDKGENLPESSIKDLKAFIDSENTFCNG